MFLQPRAVQHGPVTLCTLIIQVLLRELSRRNSSLWWVLGSQHSPAQLMQEQSAPHSQALDGHLGLFHREGVVTPEKQCWWGCIFFFASLVWAVEACFSIHCTDEVSRMKKIGFAPSFFFGSSMFSCLMRSVTSRCFIWFLQRLL